MIPVKTKTANILLIRPDSDFSIPAERKDDNEYVSYWKPTFIEKLKLIFSDGRIGVHIKSISHPVLNVMLKEKNDDGIYSTKRRNKNGKVKKISN